jgi:hypothetical protein
MIGGDDDFVAFYVTTELLAGSHYGKCFSLGSVVVPLTRRQ